MRVQLDPEDEPSVWNQDDADWLVGKYALIGITHVAADGETVTGQDQYHGRIESADSEKGIEMVCEGRWSGQKMMLPPDLAAFPPRRAWRVSAQILNRCRHRPRRARLLVDRRAGKRLTVSAIRPRLWTGAPPLARC